MYLCYNYLSKLFHECRFLNIMILKVVSNMCFYKLYMSECEPVTFIYYEIISHNFKKYYNIIYHKMTLQFTISNILSKYGNISENMHRKSNKQDLC